MKLVNSEFVEQAVVYGDNKPFLVALIVPTDEKNIILLMNKLNRN